MKIQRSYTEYTNLPTVKGSKNAARQSQAVNASNDRINLSDTAKKLLSGAEVQSSHSGIDADKVARLKAAINDGSYHVSAGRIADRMLEAVDEERA
ncbi:flagellar biosynthesis anti-sigma factor FlgM [Ligilactobacillus sp.]|uniref:flagellar biosynthesis anti-sigma factor FlgM n=1 Tax=Ligilactobacillus sp. TaxID=2767921 RepID=UPI002FE17DB8